MVGLCDGMSLLLAERARPDDRWQTAHKKFRRVRMRWTFRAKVSYKPIYLKDQCKAASIWHQYAAWYLHGICIKCGGRMVDLLIADLRRRREPVSLRHSHQKNGFKHQEVTQENCRLHVSKMNRKKSTSSSKKRTGQTLFGT